MANIVDDRLLHIQYNLTGVQAIGAISFRMVYLHFNISYTPNIHLCEINDEKPAI